MRFITLLTLLFFLPVIFPTMVWKANIGAPITAEPVFFQDFVVVGSENGYVYLLNAHTGNVIFKQFVNLSIIHSASSSSEYFAVASPEGFAVIKKDTQLTMVSRKYEDLIYGIDVDNDTIYVATKKALKAYTFSGSLKWEVPAEEEPLTPPTIAGSSIIYLSGNNLIVVNKENGSVISRIAISESWNSKPEYSLNIVYVGSTDRNVYAVDLVGKKVLWSFMTGGWVASSPKYSNGILYVGSNDGYFYALNARDGKPLWKISTDDAIQSSIKMFNIGNKEVVIFGSNDNRLYVVDTSGNIFFILTADGWIQNPAIHNGMVYFGTSEGIFYAYKLDRSCIIDEPKESEKVGYLPFKVRGRVFSLNGNVEVYIRINQGPWKKAALLNNSSWEYIADPLLYDFGEMIVECKVKDSAGEETSNFANLILYRDPDVPKGKISVELPPSIIAEKPFNITVYGVDNQPLDGFLVVVEGDGVFEGENGTATITIKDSGAYTLKIKKGGYEDKIVPIYVGIDLFFVLTVVVVVLAVLFVGFYLFIYKKKR